MSSISFISLACFHISQIIQFLPTMITCCGMTKTMHCIERIFRCVKLCMQNKSHIWLTEIETLKIAWVGPYWYEIRGRSTLQNTCPQEYLIATWRNGFCTKLYCPFELFSYSLSTIWITLYFLQFLSQNNHWGQILLTNSDLADWTEEHKFVKIISTLINSSLCDSS